MTAQTKTIRTYCDPFFALLVLGLPVAALAQHCQEGDRWNGLVSDGVNMIVADSFASPVSGTVTTVSWRGGYTAGANDCDPGVADQFEIRYRADQFGVPGVVMAGPFLQGDGSLTVVSIPTGDHLLEGIVEYRHEAQHAAVPINEGECYWLEIRNVRADGCGWYWETSEFGDHRAAQDATPGTDFTELDLLGVDLAFCLNVPIDAPVDCFTPPSNDDCPQAIAISDGDYEFSTLFAHTENVEAYECYAGGDYYNMSCCQGQADYTASHDIWYIYTPPCSAALSIDVCESDFDTKIVLYESFYGDGCPNDNSYYAEIVTCNDDGCGTEPSAPTACFHDYGIEFPCWSKVCMEAVRAQFSWCHASAFQYNLECHMRAERLCREPSGLQSDLLATVEAGTQYRIRVGSNPSDHGGGLKNDPRCRTNVCDEWPSCCTEVWNGYCDDLLTLCLGKPGKGTLRVKLVAPPPFFTTLTDVQALMNCASLPCPAPPCESPTYAEPCCLVHDLDNDGDVDAIDLTEHLVPAMTGPGFD